MCQNKLEWAISALIQIVTIIVNCKVKTRRTSSQKSLCTSIEPQRDCHCQITGCQELSMQVEPDLGQSLMGRDGGIG